ncbi:alpha-ketoglutarate-dependent dioxygenase AlkB family protein [Mucilaginibacter ginkgonis]|uniref:Alpha-ketoglutarate-dependent dioxygenase AlkB n=1 Tax=Mucilaginibacter ginkgonis TaxID=2682091 RepID=A0A6I4HXW5_9SPHI|nr:alpha-ketoglutarate-dependent dioxygenase AlkB [Mucilaginibacter ginkgonis]QQL49509.1 alpha-ketoglutarate-dependent dioxygenase AlkB [Mucilaginibacter ginkgonis]
MESKQIINLLPYDGQVDYYGIVLDELEANRYFDILLNNIDWKNDEAIIFGKHFITKRMVAWYGDQSFDYSYSNKTRRALPWTKELLELKALTEKYTGVIYNSCLLNLYHDGDEGMGWHSDDERALGKDSSIASLSFGAERKFALKHRVTKEATSIMLQNGSLLEMKGTTQSHWIHSLPKSKKVKEPRVNLTFRTMIPQ